MPLGETNKHHSYYWYDSIERRRFNAKKKINAGVSIFASSPQMGEKTILLSGNAIGRK